jgi:hypothetical protein
MLASIQDEMTGGCDHPCPAIRPIAVLTECDNPMKKIGLALSGGGFRATLYHLGLIRFLRDANILPQVTHITSVSGGSVTAAHLVLNWGRYTGSVSDFEAAAAELLSFVRLDVRNRIVRRFFWAFPSVGCEDCWGFPTAV